MRRLASCLAASALLCVAWTAAEAQEPPHVTLIEPPPAQPDAPATTVDPVTVEARRLTRPEVEKNALRFVQAYAAPTAKLDQFARWRDPICVQAIAPDPFDAAKVTARIQAVAKTLGVKVQRTGCSANIEIVFSDGPQRWLDWVAEHRDAILGFHYVSDTAVLKTVTRPIQAWYETATRSDGGARDAGLAFAVPGSRGFGGVSAHDETIDNPADDSPAGCGDSRFSSCLQSVFKNVLVFVDTGRSKTPDLGPVSDYLAMLTLSQPRSLDGCAAFASVIDLLATNCPGRSPDGLTPADTAYLKALYEADLEARRASEETDIASRMAKNLIMARDRSSAEANGR